MHDKSNKRLIFCGFLFVLGLFMLGSGFVPVVSAQTELSSTSFTRDLTIGSEGTDVSTLQAFLITNGFLHVAAPTGYFGAMTSDAVAAWQAVSGLPATGFFGPLSRAAIIGSTAVAPATSNSVESTMIPAPATTNTNTYTENLTVGDTGAEVSALQSTLITDGFLDVATPTGYFGPMTAVAVARWQATVGLPTTGYFGPMSRAALQGDSNITTIPNSAPNITIENTLQPSSAGGGGGGGASSPSIVTASTPPVTTDNTGGGGGGGSSSGGGGGGGSSSGGGGGGGGFVSNPPPSEDITPPTASITSPTNGATVSGKINVDVSASDNVGVTKVEFFLGSTFEAAATNSPYVWSWNTASTSNANYILGAIAYDAAGNAGPAKSIVVTVNNPTSSPDKIPPTVSITSPANGVTVSGKVSVSANASDNVGVTKVEFYLGSTLETTVTNAPYVWTWNTTSKPNANYILGAIAYDAAGNKTSANGVTVTVSNATSSPDITPPTASITSPTNGATVSGKINVDVSASDNVGVTKVEFFLGSTFEAAATNSPYVWSWNTASTSNATYVVGAIAYDAAGNKTSANGVTVTVNNPTPIPTPDNKFGLSVGETLLGLSTTTLNNDLNDIQSLGVGWLRFDIQWAHVQADGSDHYQWTDIDQFVTAALAHHIRLLAVLNNTPTWDMSPKCTTGSDRCLPNNDQDYDTFVQAAVARYQSQIGFWEIWNEPNLKDELLQSGNASAYAALLKGAYSTIKAQDPTAFVISGGTAPAATVGTTSISPIDFLTQLYADGAGNSFDAVGFHPYSIPAMPLYYQTWNAWQQMANTTPSLRSVMTANGDASKPIWLTEYGAATGGPGVLESSATDTLFKGRPDHVTEALQAQMMVQAINAAATYPWAGPLFWYSYQDIGTSTSTIQNFFGLYRFDGTPKPAYAALKSLDL